MSTMEDKKRVRCLVVGAGPVGALAALYASERGWDVEIYELRGDLRDEQTTPLNFTKSINLALSERGINAMQTLGSRSLVDAVLAATIPMYGRMIHVRDPRGRSAEISQAYDIHNRSIRAIDRTKLNTLLLNELEARQNVRILFHHKMTGADFVKQKAWFEQKDSIAPTSKATEKRAREIEVDFDVILGCDGAHSSVRYHMMKFVRMNYAQEYIDVLWCEFTMPPAHQKSFLSPSATEGFVTDPYHLHIWPSSDKMFIAIPSADKSFTCTLFASSADFAALETDPKLLEAFFDTNFPGASDLVGRSQLAQQFRNNPHLPLISIKCSPHHYESTGVILGDAAHAMVPFYGQGMNAGLEDVRVLFSHFDAHSDTSQGRAQALSAYTQERVPDAHTINDLALSNYWEMHAGVQSPIYLLRKKLEEFLADKIPMTGFATQYSRVSFSTQRYSEVSRAVARQSTVLIAGMLVAAITPLLGFSAWRIWGIRRAPSPIGVHLGRLWTRAVG